MYLPEEEKNPKDLDFKSININSDEINIILCKIFIHTVNNFL